MNLLQGTPWHAYVQPIGCTLVHFLWQGAVVAILLSVTLLCLRSRSANARYLAATVALGGMALCPPLTLAVLTSRRAPSPAPFVSLLPELKGLAVPGPSLPTRLDALQNGFPPASPVVGQMPAGRAASRLNALLSGLVAAWLLGVLLLSTRLLGGWVRVQFLMRRAIWPIEGSIAARCEELARRMGIARPVALRASMAVQVPSVAGWLRAVILFPAGALTGLPGEQIEALLAHELAHVRRHDYLINLMQSAIETLLFYHPAVWWVSRRLRVERELCCDDLVVQVLDDRVGYARALMALEQMRGLPASPALAATDGDLLARVRRILGLPSETVRTAPLPFAGTASLLFCMALCAGLFLQLARAGQAAGNTPPAKAAPIQTAGLAPAAQPAKSAPKATDSHRTASPTGRATTDGSDAGDPWQSSTITIDPEKDAPRPQPQQPSDPMRPLPATPEAEHAPPIHLAGLTVSKCNISHHQADPDTTRIERDIDRIGKRMEAISRQLKNKDLTCQQRKRLEARLGELGGELGVKAAQIAVEQADHAVSMADKEVRRALDQVDVQKLVKQALDCAFKDKDKEENQDRDAPDPPDPPDTSNSDD